MDRSPNWYGTGLLILRNIVPFSVRPRGDPPLLKRENMNCKNCGKKLPHITRKFCSSKCSAIYNNTGRKYSDKTKKKISIGVRKNIVKKEKILRVCKQCDKITTNSKFCSVKCSNRYLKEKKDKERTEYEQYYFDCSFKFNVYEYPNIFNLELLNKYGWYHPVKNPNGISRDHKFSISEGFKNNIDSKIISHVLNCDLIIHKTNNKKNTSCSIDLEQLINDIGRVSEWSKEAVCKTECRKTRKFKSSHALQ